MPGKLSTVMYCNFISCVSTACYSILTLRPWSDIGCSFDHEYWRCVSDLFTKNRLNQTVVCRQHITCSQNSRFQRPMYTTASVYALLTSTVMLWSWLQPRH